MKTEKGCETKQLSLTVGLLVRRLAKQPSAREISLNQLINLAVAEKISAYGRILSWAETAGKCRKSTEDFEARRQRSTTRE